MRKKTDKNYSDKYIYIDAHEFNGEFQVGSGKCAQQTTNNEHLSKCQRLQQRIVHGFVFFLAQSDFLRCFFFIIFCLHDLTECKRLNANDLLTDNSMVISSFVKSFEPCHSIVHSFSVNTLSNT